LSLRVPGRSVTERDATRTVTVTATGRAEGTPDRATVAFGVRGTAESVAEARQRATDAASALFDVLAERGVPEEAVGTRRFSVGERDRGDGVHDPGGRPGDDPEGPTTYVAEQVVGYRTTDLDTLEAVVTAAVDDAGGEVDRLGFGFSESTRRNLREAALADAMGAARSQATTVAEAEGLVAGAVRTVETGETRGGGERLDTRHGGRGRSTVDLTPERETVTARVTVVYELQAPATEGENAGEGGVDGS
jgi:hypothetical protein